MTRRKCRTWQPNEITSIIRSSQESSNTDLSPETSFCHSSQRTSASEVPQSQEGSFSQDQASTSANEEAHNGGFAGTMNEQADVDLPETSRGGEAEKNPEVLLQSSDAERRAPTKPLAEPMDPPQGLGIHNDPELITRRSGDTSLAENLESKENAEDSELRRPGDTKNARKRPTIRLSMSQEGLAEVVTKSNSTSPEKPLSQPQGMTGHVDHGVIRTQASSQPASLSTSAGKHRSKAKTHGRSRDARAWEFYCDSDARNALTTAAEHEREGSARGALGLIRSNSTGQRPLQPSKKGNRPLLNGDAAKRKDAVLLEKKPPKLARTSSSFARLQSSSKAVLSDSVNKEKGQKAIAIWEDPDGDSDKENWEPGTHITRPRHSRFADPGRSLAVLRENDRELSHSSSFGSLMAREKASPARRSKVMAGSHVNEKENAVGDDEVARFMGESSQVYGDEDNDAVQSLLSLSQGAWG